MNIATIKSRLQKDQRQLAALNKLIRLIKDWDQKPEWSGNYEMGHVLHEAEAMKPKIERRIHCYEKRLDGAKTA